MKKLLLLIAILASSVQAREKLQGWCQEGNKTVTTNGVVSTTLVQRSYPSCTVTVYLAGTLTLATIYSDNAGTPKSNPFTASAGGLWFFYSANARYDVKFSGGAITTPFTLGDFLLFDPGASGFISSINSQTGPTITFAVGTAGANFNISAAANVVTLNLPNASASNRGALTASDWNSFNGKESTLTFNAPLSRTANAVSLLTPIAISNGGTGQTIANPAFNALAPTTTAGDMLVHNGTINVRFAAGTTGQCLKANTALTNKMEWVSCFGGPISVSDGGTGASTLTGSLVGNGTSAFTGVAASSPLMVYRRQPNVSTTTYQFSGPFYLSSADFDFPSQAPGGTLTAAVGASITMTPCPLGLNGADTAHYIYISGGVGSAEAVLITGGTCTSGASTGTVTFTPANNHSGAWVVTSATQGVQEAICYLPASDNTVRIPAGTITLNANVAYCGETDVRIEIGNGVTLAGSGTLPSTVGGGYVTNDYRVSSIGTTGARWGNVALTAQTAAIATASLIAAAPAGLYRVSGYLQTTTASVGVCTSDVTLGWTYNSSAKTLQIVVNHDQAVDEGYSQIPETIVRNDAGVNLTYAVSLDAGGGDCTSAAFAVFAVAERLQ